MILVCELCISYYFCYLHVNVQEKVMSIPNLLKQRAQRSLCITNHCMSKELNIVLKVRTAMNEARSLTKPMMQCVPSLLSGG